MPFDISLLQQHWGNLATGVLMTLGISLGAAVLGSLFGGIAALGMKGATRPLSFLTRAYVQLFRNTPLLIQLYFFYKGLPQLGIVLSPWECGIWALSLQTGAYVAEIIRAGIEAIPREQFESGVSLGFTRKETYMTVILPQALKIILPPLGNQMVSVIKNSALVAFISVPDLFYVIFSGGANTFHYMEFFAVGILIYMSLTLGVSAAFSWLETRLVYDRQMNRDVCHA